METTVACWGYIEVEDYMRVHTIMENQMEKKMEMQWKNGLYRGLHGVGFL